MVTGEQVKAAAIAAGVTRVDHHDCSGCGAMVFYSVDHGRLFFHPQCHCTRGYSPPEQRPWNDAADWINMQTHAEHRVRIAKLFGLEVE